MALDEIGGRVPVLVGVGALRTDDEVFEHFSTVLGKAGTRALNGSFVAVAAFDTSGRFQKVYDGVNFNSSVSKAATAFRSQA